MSELPKWVTEKHIAEHFAAFGSVIKIDMPKTDARIQKLKENAPNPENERKVQKSYEDRQKLAEKVFKDLQYSAYPHLHFEVNQEDFAAKVSDPTDKTTLAEKILNFDKDLYKENVRTQLSQKLPSDLRLINNEKRMKILTLCTMVYNENQLVNDSLKDIKTERDALVNRLNNVMEYPEIPGNKSSESYISSEQIQTLKNYLSYIDKNHDSLPPEIISEVRENKAFQVIRDYHMERSGKIPSDTNIIQEALKTRISQSQTNIMKELAEGYQWLSQSLERREKILKHRLDRLLADYGNKDRILVEKKDFKNELEDIEYEGFRVGDNMIRLEDIVSISEQMRNISDWKKPKTLAELEERSKHESMFDYDKPNFGDHDINFSEITPRTIDLIRKRTIDPDIPVDLQKIHSKVPNNYDTEVMHIITKKVNAARKEIDTPFDEMYHREKALIDNVVKAEKELIEAQEAAQIQVGKNTGSVAHLFDNNLVGLYKNEDDLRVLLKKEGTQDDSADSLFSETRNLSRNYQDLVVELIGDRNIDKYLDQQSYIQNLGY